METSHEQKTEVDKGTQYLSFFVGGEEYAIGILRVKEIMEFGNVTRVPNTPPWVRGVTNVRGNVVPVVDLAARFGLAPATVGNTTCVIILEVQLDGDPTTMGVVVDSVSEVIEFPPKDVEPTPSFGTQVRPDFLIGMGKWNGKFVLLVDIDKVLSLRELLASTAALQSEASGQKTALSSESASAPAPRPQAP